MRIPLVNMLAGWTGILGGILTGAVIGIFIQRDEWLGGYQSRSRRLLRLGHISCLGFGLLNLLFALSFALLNLDEQHSQVAAWGLILALGTMPLCCFLAAWRWSLGLLLPIPVVAAVAGLAAILFGHHP